MRRRSRFASSASRRLRAVDPSERRQPQTHGKPRTAPTIAASDCSNSSPTTGPSPRSRRRSRSIPAVRLARINLAIAQFYAGRTQEAAASAREAQQDYPDAPEPSYLLGLIARADNQPDEAVRQFERVLRVDPDDPGARINLAMVLLDQRRYKEAATLAESALAIEPYNATAAYTAAMALTRMGDGGAGSGRRRRLD